MRHIILLFLLPLLACGLITGHAQEVYRTGSAHSIDTSHQAGIVLAGGATDNDDAMRWMLQRAQGGDVVVLRASGSDGYNNYFYSDLDVAINSVTSIVVASRAEAANQQVLDLVEQAEVVFLAGGDQWNYIDYWTDTPLQDLLNKIINQKGITIGGTSAGMAVLGQVSFSAENNTVWSSEALGNPYHWRLMLEKDFLAVPFLEHTITDTHYNRVQGDEMERKGRHVAFLARMVADWQMPARGVAANEYTAIAIDEEGIARVFGNPSYDDYAYFLQAYGGDPEECREAEPLHWHRQGQAIMVYRVRGDHQGTGWFSLDDWMTGSGGKWHHWYVDQGTLHESGPLEDAGWIRVHVKDAHLDQPLKGATVNLDNYEPMQTPSFGITNFRGMLNIGSLQLRVGNEGFLTHQEDLYFDGNNLHVEVLLESEGTHVVLTGSLHAEPFIYPNPSFGALSLYTGSLQGRIQLRLLSIQGALMDSWSAKVRPHSRLQMAAREVPPGSYLLEISAGGLRATKIWIKQ